MATVLDIGLLEAFSRIFGMLLVVFLVYGVLDYSKLFGEKKALYALIAFMMGLTMLFVPSVAELITVITPWFVVIFLLVIFILLTIGIFGAKEEDFLSALKSPRGNQIVTWVIFFSIIIFLAGLGKVFFTGENEIPKVSDEGVVQTGEVGATGTSAFWATIFHPKVLGMICVMVIGLFTIMLLTAQPKVY